MKIGFSATRSGLTDQQAAVLETLMDGEFHHGDCLGGDEDGHHIAASNDLKIVIHPPSDSKHRAWCKALGCTIKPPKPYLERNREIVLATQFLIAAPATEYEIARSGTWATVRYARGLKRPIIVILPSGKVRIESGSFELP